MELMDFINESMLIMTPALYVLGMVLKNTALLKDKYIPVALICIGIIGAIGLGGLNAESAIQGVLMAGLTTLGNQTIKQLKKEE